MKHYRLALTVLALAFGGAGPATAGTIYDLAADWSDASNPAGAWSYGLRSASGTFTPFPLHVNDYINVGPPEFTGNQPAWTNTLQTGNNGSPEGLAKSVGIALDDFPRGRVGGHTPVSSSYLAVRWTAPAAGTVDLSGDVWMWRNLGRSEGVSLFVDGAALFNDVPIPPQPGTDSSNPFLLSAAAIAGGGTAAELLNISVSAGDTVTLATRRLNAEDFVGMDFAIDFVPNHVVPEPTSLALLGLGVLSLAGYSRIRHRGNRADGGSFA